MTWRSGRTPRSSSCSTGPRSDGQLRALPDQGPRLDDPPARQRRPGPMQCPTPIKPMLAVAGKASGGQRGLGLRDQMGRGPGHALSSKGDACGPRAGTTSTSRSRSRKLADIGKFLGMTTCVIDGEIVALGEDGRPSFSRLQQRMHVSNQREAKRRSLSDPVTFVAFDLLYLDGHSLLDSRLRRTTGAAGVTAPLRRDVHHDGLVPRRLRAGHPGPPPWRTASRAWSPSDGSSSYRPGRRSPDWTKVKSFRTQEVVIGAWTEGRGERRDSLGALLLGIPEDGGLRYVGKVGTGFSARARATLLDDLEAPGHRDNPFVCGPPDRRRGQRRTSFAPNWSGRSSSANGPRRAACATRPGGACDRDKAPMKSSWSDGQQSTRTTIDGRELSVSNLEKVLFPADRLHQGSADRLLRARRPGDAAAPS